MMVTPRDVIKLGSLGRVVACAIAAFATSAPLVAQAPDTDWRTLRTEHFRVTFPAGLESLGRRAAARAEIAYDLLSQALIEPEAGTIDLLVTDHTDLANGFALERPSRRITVHAAPPMDGLSLAYFDDWMELVITHELAHVFHLDYTSSALGRIGRAVFGRAFAQWPLFPSLAMPDWVIEGLATWYETDLTGAGRVAGTFHEMQLRTTVLEDRFEGLGQASGRSPLWPGGNRSYLYGSLFFDHLLREHGEERMHAFVEVVGGQWIPYRLDAAGREAFGVSISEAWRAWASDLETRYRDLDLRLSAYGPVSEPERLTPGSRWALYPKVSPDGRTLVHAASDGRSDTQLRRRPAAGGAGATVARTNGVATFDWMPDGRLLVSQLEYADPYTVYGDLWIMTLDGASERLTRGARLAQPAVLPDGREALSVRHGEGTTELVRVDLDDGTVTPLVRAAPGTHWAFPRPSPDGRWIAAARWTTGAFQDVVLLDASGRVAREVTADRAADLAPAWSPDGRWLVWTSDRTGTMNVLGVRVDPVAGPMGEPVLLTNVRTGATFPSVSPDGASLLFSTHHVDGWEVERLPFAPGAAPPAPPPDPRFVATRPPPDPVEEAGDVGGYDPFPTLLPHYWEPRYREAVVAPALSTGSLSFRRRTLLGFGLGAETGGSDLVGRHRYGVFGQLFTSGGRFEAGAEYSFSGLGNPVLALRADQGWFYGGRLLPTNPADTLFVLDRERSIGTSVTFLSTRWRHAAAVSVGGALVWQKSDILENDLSVSDTYAFPRSVGRLGELTLSAFFTTARSHSFQIGGTRGLSLFAQGRTRSQFGLSPGEVGVAGTDRGFDDLYGRFRAYVPLWGGGYATHVLALQVAGGASRGPGVSSGRFLVGGASGTSEELTGFTLFGGGPLALPVRGYEVGVLFGRYAWAGSAEYRFPIALVHRGLGPWPLYFDRFLGSLFFDAGNAWAPTDLGRPVASAGVELSAQIVGRWETPLLLRTGVAFPVTRSDDPTLYVRVGVPF